MHSVQDRGRDLDPPTDHEVEQVVDLLRRWKFVDPHQRANLRAAVAALPLMELVPAPLPKVPLDRPLRVAEVAGLLRVSTGTVRALIRMGTLPGYTLSGRKGSEYRVLESSVREYLDRVAVAQ
jgi:excisionase family DNA binding protein